MILTDFTRPVDEIIVELINYDNGTTLPLNGLIYGEPFELADAPYNTMLVVTAKPTLRWMGSITIRYNRVNLEDILGARPKFYDDGQATLISHLIPALNEAYELNLQPIDYIDGPLPPLNPSNFLRVFTLVANPLSLIWTGEVDLQFDLHQRPSLEDILTVTNLSGFEYSMDELQVINLSGFEYPIT